MRLFIGLIFIFFGINFTLGQEQLGLHSSQFSGGGASTYNPASFQAGALNWDFMILSGGVFVETDYLFVADATVLDLFSNDLYRIQPELGTSQALGPGELGYVFTNGTRQLYNSTNAFIAFPTISVRVGSKYSIGFFGQIRQAFSANNVDPFWSYPRLEFWNYSELRTSDPLWTSAMLWTEIGLNVARQFKVSSNRLSVGVNAKFLMGHESVTAFVPNTTDVTLNPLDYTVNTSTAYYGFTDFEDGTSLEGKGTGLAFDLGFVFQVPDEDEVYVWQFSAALNDLGWIGFNRKASYHVVESDQNETIDRAGLDAVQWLDDFAATVSNDVYGDPTTSLRANEYRVVMPTAISLSLDRKLTKNLFVQAALTRRIRLNPHQVQRDNMWAISTRYATRFFELGIPFVLFNDRKPRIGTWIRLGPLTIGSDHLLTWFVPQNRLSGSDVYFSLRLNESLFRKQRSKNPDECYW